MTGRQQPSLREPTPFYPVPREQECLRCLEQLEPERQAICVSCTGDINVTSPRPEV